MLDLTNMNVMLFQEVNDMSMKNEMLHCHAIHNQPFCFFECNSILEHISIYHDKP